MTVIIDVTYTNLCHVKSDINEHLPVLQSLARECFSVAELGVREPVSTWALLSGLKSSYVTHAANKRMVCVDIIDIPALASVAKIAMTEGRIDLSYIKHDSALVELPYNVDLLFIDTWHIYGHLRRELSKHASNTRKYIVMHDTEVDAEKVLSVLGWEWTSIGFQSRLGTRPTI